MDALVGAASAGLATQGIPLLLLLASCLVYAYAHAVRQGQTLEIARHIVATQATSVSAVATWLLRGLSSAPPSYALYFPQGAASAAP